MAGIGDMTDDERAAALRKAAEVRTARAELKSLLKMGSIDLAEVLARAETDEMVGRTKVLSVLESLPGLGKIGSRRLMERIGIAENRRLRGLGDRQREALLAELG